MNIVRKVLVDRMINLYGRHTTLTVQFVDLCKRMADNTRNDKTLITLVESHEKHPITEYLKKGDARK